MEPNIETVVTFIRTEGPKLHDGIGGSSRFDEQAAKFVPSQPYLKLARALKLYVSDVLKVEMEDDFREAWNLMSEKISRAEDGYNENKKGFWRQLWYNIGESGGLAVVLHLAGKSVLKRQKILDTFLGLRNALMRASPTERSFRDNPIVGNCADQLYKVVVSSIHEMILVTSKDQRSWRHPTTRLTHRQPHPDPDEILQKVTDSVDNFERALGNARDQIIEATSRVGQHTAILSADINHVVNKHGEKLETLGIEFRERYSKFGLSMEILTAETKRSSERDEVWQKQLPDSIVDKIIEALDHRFIIMPREIEAREIAMRDAQIRSNNGFLDLLIPQLQKMFDETRDDQAISLRRHEDDRIQKRHTTLLVGLNGLCRLLAQPNPDKLESVDLDLVFRHPNKDIELALMQQSRFTTTIQGQIQSLLHGSRFIKWISCHSHTSARDVWYGPNGLVRSFIVQVLMRLVRMKVLNLDFVDDEDFWIDLEEHNLDRLFTLVSQLPRKVMLYCIIDSVSSFDNTSMFNGLKVVLDSSSRCSKIIPLLQLFKVLITNTGSSTWRTKTLLMLREFPSRLINLSSNLTPMRMSSQSVEDHLGRRSTPATSSYSRRDSRNRRRSDGEKFSIEEY